MKVEHRKTVCVLLQKSQWLGAAGEVVERDERAGRMGGRDRHPAGLGPTVAGVAHQLLLWRSSRLSARTRDCRNDLTD